MLIRIFSPLYSDSDFHLIRDVIIELRQNSKRDPRDYVALWYSTKIGFQQSTEFKAFEYTDFNTFFDSTSEAELPTVLTNVNLPLSLPANQPERLDLKRPIQQYGGMRESQRLWLPPIIPGVDYTPTPGIYQLPPIRGNSPNPFNWPTDPRGPQGHNLPPLNQVFPNPPRNH